jgi:hypothetical protein
LAATGELAFCAFHPCAPGEVESIEPHAHHVRTDEYALFRTEGWSAWLQAQSFVPTSMRSLREALRG